MRSSQPEERLYQILVNRFCNDDVIHHINIDGFRIDFYIKSINTYVELDGIYWHGLDKSYDQLAGTPKAKFDRDVLCNKHFEEKGLRLIRIADKELKENEKHALSRI